jgi:[acyl-carrier-protein] S-malonyltransferase
MKPVAEELKKAFEKIEWHAPKFPIVTNVDAKPVSTVEEIKDALYRQTYSPVLWCQSVLEMEKYGADGYIELGPGSVLSGLVRKICKGKRPYPVSETEELGKALSFLRGEA